MGHKGRRSFATAAADGRLLGRLAADLAAEGNSATRLREAVVQLAELDRSRCAAMLVSEDGRLLRPVTFHDASGAGQATVEAAPKEAQELGRGLAGRVAQTGVASIITAATARQWARSDLHAARCLEARPISTIMIAPLRAGSRLLGTLGLSRPPSQAPFASADLEALRDVAAIVSLALDAALVREWVIGETALPPGVDARISELSTREVEVLTLVGAGLTNREIGERLSLSTRTVEWHRARLKCKLGARERSELVAIARTHLPPPPPASR